MGPKICPSTPVIVNSGRNAVTVIVAVKKIALSTWRDAHENEAEPLRPGRPSLGWARRRRVAPPRSLGELVKELLFRCGRRLEDAEDVFDQDHGRVDDNAEVHRAEREKIGILAPQHEDDDGKEQRERDIRADDDSAPQVAEKDPLYEEDEQASEEQIVQDCMGCHPNEQTAIVVGHHLHSRRQRPVGINLFDFRHHPRQDVVGVLRFAP